MFWEKLLIATKVVVILSVIGILFYIWNRIVMPFGGTIEKTYEFCQDSKSFSHLDPWNRVSPPTPGDDGCFQKFYDNLVYFTFALPEYFRVLDATLVYQTPDQEEISFGPQVNPEVYNMVLLDRTIVDAEKNIYVSHVRFDLKKAYTIDKTIKFIISTPELREQSHTLNLYAIKFSLSSPTFDVNAINPRIKNILKKWIQ